MIERENQLKPKSYKTSGTTIAFGLGVSVLLVIFGIAIVLPDALKHKGPPLWFALFWTLGVVVVFAGMLRTVIEIRIRPDESVELRNVLRRQTVLPIRSIRAVSAHPLSYYSFTIAYAEGKATVLLPMRDLYEFLAWLKQRNPEVKISWL